MDVCAGEDRVQRARVGPNTKSPCRAGLIECLC